MAALTPAQRLHLEVYGYVVIEDALGAVETKALLERIYEIEDDFHAGGPIRAAGNPGIPWGAHGGPTDDWDPDLRTHYYQGRTRQYFRVDNLPHLGDVFLAHVTHPRLVALAEEAIGGESRLEQSDAHIVRPRPVDEQRYGFHRGSSARTSYTLDDLYHYPFVKTLTNLTDLGPDDGGTTVIAGSHKLDDDLTPHVLRAALDDPSKKLVHSVVAPAGSTLLFFESLLHSGGIMRSDRDRVFIVGGYTPTHYQPWEGYAPALSLREHVPPEVWAFLNGDKGWRWKARGRRLDEAAGPSA